MKAFSTVNQFFNTDNGSTISLQSLINREIEKYFKIVNVPDNGTAVRLCGAPSKMIYNICSNDSLLDHQPVFTYRYPLILDKQSYFDGRFS